MSQKRRGVSGKTSDALLQGSFKQISTKFVFACRDRRQKLLNKCKEACAWVHFQATQTVATRFPKGFQKVALGVLPSGHFRDSWKDAQQL